MTQRSMGEIPEDEHYDRVEKMIREVSTNHFMEAAHKMYWENTKRLGVELTGKDITNNDDVLCIRRTFDESQNCRVKKEKKRDAILTEGAKEKMIWIGLFVSICLGIWGKTT